MDGTGLIFFLAVFYLIFRFMQTKLRMNISRITMKAKLILGTEEELVMLTKYYVRGLDQDILIPGRGY